MSAGRPSFAALPSVGLLTLPTPVERMKSLSSSVGIDVWCKRDDLICPTYGGNKARKLDAILKLAVDQGADVLVTTSFAGAHQALATALLGRRLALRTHALLIPNARSPFTEENLRALWTDGLSVERTNEVLAPLAAARAMWRLRRSGAAPFSVPGAGTSPLGNATYARAALELADDVASGAMSHDAIYVAIGSGGTAAGLAVGLAAAGLETRLMAVAVAKPVALYRPLLRREIHRTVALLRRLAPGFPDVSRAALDLVTVRGDEVGAGYGRTTAASLAAVEQAADDGVRLEPIYTGKALATLIADAAGGVARQPLFWNTYARPPAGAREEPPAEVLALLRE